MSTECRTVLLADEPAISDTLGPHESVADAILETIRTSEGNRAIGLVGKWGSGKSTVINLLRAKAQESSDSRVFVFDAWAHEGDPLRRSFLERLLAFLCAQGWLDKEAARIRAKVITGRLKTVDVTQSTRPTWFAVLFAFALLIAPIGFVSFGDVLASETPLPFRALLSWVAMLGPGLVAAVFIVVAMIKKTSVLEVLAVMVHPTVQEVTTETFSEPEATSVEFETHFSEIVREALGGNDRVLVVVLDNLDRVDARTAESIWTSLQAFIGGLGQRTASNQRLWFVVPYDRRRLGSNGDRVSETEDGYLSKLISIRFSVPEPVLSHWRDYLEAALKEALPDHDENDFASVYFVYYAHTLTSKRTPTPRDIKKFVNQLGGIHRLRGHQFPLRDMAYFALLELDGADVPTGVIESVLPATGLRDLLSETAATSILALHFGAEEEAAQQILLNGPIREALASADAESLKRLGRVDGFMTVLQTLDFASDEAVPGKAVPYAFVALDGADLWAVATTPPNRFSQGLRRVLLETEQWDLSDPSIAEGLALALTRLEDDVRVAVLTALSDSSGREKLPAEDAVEWAYGLRTILLRLRTEGRALPAELSIEIPAEPSSWFRIVDAVSDGGADSDLARMITFEEEIATIVAATSSELESRSLTDLGVSEAGIRVLSSLAPDANWDALWQAVESKILESGGDAEEAGKLALFAVSEKMPGSEGMISRLAESAPVRQRLDKALQANDSGLASDILSILLRATYSYGMEGLFSELAVSDTYTAVRKFFRRPTKYPDVLKALFETSESHRDMAGLLITAAKRQELVGLAASFISLSAANGTLGDVLPKSELILAWRNFQPIFAQLSDEDKAFLSHSFRDQGLQDEVVASSFDLSTVDLYLDLGRTQEWDSEEYARWLEGQLSSRQEIEWKNALIAGSEMALLAVEATRGGAKLDLGPVFAHAVLGIAKSVAVADELPIPVRDNWIEVCALLGDSIDYVRRGVLRELIQLEGVASPHFYWLTESIGMSTEILASEDRLIEKLLNPIVSSHNREGLRWMTGVFRNHPELLGRLQDWEAFEEVVLIQSRSMTSDVGTTQELQELAEAAGIDMASGAGTGELDTLNPGTAELTNAESED